MGLNWDPSHDADRYFADQEQAAEAERRFYATNADRICTVLAGLCSNPAMVTIDQGARLNGRFEPTVANKDLVDLAVELVQIVTGRGSDEYTGEFSPDPLVVEIKRTRRPK